MTRTLIRGDGAVLVIRDRTDDHLAAHPTVTDALLLDAFARCDLARPGRALRCAVDLGRIVGHSSKVTAEHILPTDRTTFAFRKNRARPSRVVLGAEKPASSVVSMVVERGGRARFVLRTAYVGEPGLPEPFSLGAIKDMKLRRGQVMAYWCRHALVWDEREFQGRPFVASWAEVVRRGGW